MLYMGNRSSILLSRVLHVATSILLCSDMAGAEDWPQWRGSGRDGISTEKGLLKKWPKNGPARDWVIHGIGIGFSCPAVVENMIYVTGDIGPDLKIFALDLKGKRKWAVTHGSAWTDNKYPGARSTPTIDADCLYLLSGTGLVGCYETKTGRKKWSVDLVRTFGSSTPYFGYSESVLIHGELAIVTPGGRNCIVALNKLTGETVWVSTGLDDPAGYASCISFTHMKIPMLVTLTGSSYPHPPIEKDKRGMICLDARSGQLLWRNNRVSHTSGPTVTPTYKDANIFSPSGTYLGGVAICSQILVSGRNVTEKPIWKIQGGRKGMECRTGGYVVYNDYIYANHRNAWVCLDFKTGQRK